MQLATSKHALSPSKAISMLLLLIVFSSLFASTSCSDLDRNDFKNSSTAILPVRSAASVLSNSMLQSFLQIFFLLLLLLLLFAPVTVSLSFASVAVGVGVGATTGTAYVVKRTVDSLPPDDKKNLFEDPISFSLSRVRNFTNDKIRSLLPSWAGSVSMLATSLKDLCRRHPMLCGLATVTFGWFVLPIAGIVYTVYAFLFLVQWASLVSIIFSLLSLLFSFLFSRSFMLGTIVSLIGLGFMMRGNEMFGIPTCFIAASFFAAAFLQNLWSVFNSVFPHLVPSYFVQGILEATPANISIPTLADSGPSDNESGSAKGWRFNSPEFIAASCLLGIVVVWFVVVVVMRVILHRRSMENPPSSDPQSEVRVSRLSL